MSGSRSQVTAPGLVEDLHARSCPVCHHLTGYIFNFLADWQHALVEEEEAIRVFASEWGFCQVHLWQLASMMSTWGICRGFRPLLDNWASLLEKIVNVPEASEEVKISLTRKHLPCRVCLAQKEAEAAYLSQLAALLEDYDGRRFYAQSQGVCLRHLELLRGLLSREAGDFLLIETARRFRETAAHMRRHVEKREATPPGVLTPDEKAAGQRAVISLAGGKNIPPI